MNERNYTAKQEYLLNEADRWFERNFKNIEGIGVSYGTELIADFLDRQKIDRNLNVLEIGCSFGYNLVYLLNKYKNIKCYGIEPSKNAIAYGNEKYSEYIESGKMCLYQGTIDDLPFDNSFFDVVLVGFCLYQVDRELLYKSISEIDRVSNNGSFVTITDFEPLYRYKRINVHNRLVPTFKSDYSKYFTGGGIIWLKNIHIVLIQKNIFL